jgi:hypothetical protein
MLVWGGWLTNYLPLHLWSTICFGIENTFGGYDPSQGWIFTAGLKGFKSTIGIFDGDLPIHPLYSLTEIFYPGIYGFTGIYIYNYFTDHPVSYYFGTGLLVQIQERDISSLH